MKVVVKSSYEELSKYAANIIKEIIVKKPNAILGLATGSTPLGLYKELINMYKNKEIDFENIKTFNLDEYIGLGKDNPQSYTYYMIENLFKHINIKKESTYIPNGKSENLEEECITYDKRIEECGGIDIQLLGIGENGHIAFIEPNDELSLVTSVVPLTKSTIEVNSRFFDSVEDVPTTAISMGIGSIMKARKIILLASGKNKAKAINQLINRKTLTTKVPASPLLLHPDVTIIVDEEAYTRHDHYQ